MTLFIAKEKPCFSYVYLPDIADLYREAYKSIDQLSGPVGNAAKKLEIRVENYAKSITLKALNLLDRYELLGLYQGVPLIQKYDDVDGFSKESDVIHLFRCPIIRYAVEKRKDVYCIVRSVLMHEVCHHMGSNDVDLFLT